VKATGFVQSAKTPKHHNLPRDLVQGFSLKLFLHHTLLSLTKVGLIHSHPTSRVVTYCDI
jgi:hypothetical protein